MMYMFLFVLILFAWCFLQVFSCIMETNLSAERRNEMYINETNEIIEVDAVPMTPRSASQNPIKIIITNDNIV